MPFKIIRIDLAPDKFSQDKRDELTRYLMDQWDRAQKARSEQISDKQARWDRNYNGVPKEATRTVPFYKSSNFVVKLIRIYIDTFIARTLNIIFSTRPLYTIDGYPRAIKEAVEMYANRKARYDWDHYNLANDILNRGTKNGTAVTKLCWFERNSIDVMPSAVGSHTENQVKLFEGPKAAVIPFEDFYVFPITANRMEDVEVKFHRVRYTAEMAKQRMRSGETLGWDLTEEEIDTAAKLPGDIKRTQQQQDAGVYDMHLRELQNIECHLEYPITNDAGKYYSIVAVLNPDLNKIIDLYYNPYPGNFETFYDYRPAPREDFFFGQSWCELLEQSQEEASQIHNDRRNAATLASGPIFKRRSGSLIPNPSTNLYPGKVFDLEDMSDLEVVEIGREIGDLMQEESMTLQLAERLIGISPEMQGLAQGQQSRGMYNTGGTLAVMSEGNQRQDTNIRDAREVFGSIARCSFLMQATFNPNDPMIEMFAPEVQAQIQQGIQMTNASRIRMTRFEVNTSDAGANREIEKASMMQMANVLAQYAQTIQQLAPQLVNPQFNPSLRLILNDIITMQAWMAKRLMRLYEQDDAEEIIPDVRKALEITIPGGGSGTKDLPPQPMGGPGATGMEPGGPGNGQGPVDRSSLSAIAALAGPNGPATPNGGLAR